LIQKDFKPCPARAPGVAVQSWRIAMYNAVAPDTMTPAERLDETALLLTLAMLRLWRKRRKKRAFSPRNSLELPAETRLNVSEAIE
jgi:hypothetical protein